MKDTTTVTTTELARNTAHIINEVTHGGKTITIKRHGTPVATLSPSKNKARSKLTYEEAIEKYAGSIPDFPDVTKDRRSRKKFPEL